jgi:triacylglycerol lipase
MDEVLLVGEGMDAALSQKIREIGCEISVHNARATASLIAPRHSAGAEDGVVVVRDLSYGSHPRQVLDVFRPRSVPSPRPAVVFVHGGNFVAGAKSTPDSPFYDNVGSWAVAHGCIGVTINYRLAPDFRHPSGNEDVAAVLDWVERNIARFGGDPDRVVLVGASAGAIHVAGHIAETASSPRIAGAALLSGIYNFAGLEDDPVLREYFGGAKDVSDASPLPRLAIAEVPLMVAVAEYDPVGHQKQFLQLAGAMLAYQGSLPRLHRLAGHNHFSTVLHLGVGETELSIALASFVHQLGPRRPALIAGGVVPAHAREISSQEGMR